MVRSGTIKTLAALVAALTVGAGVLIWMETDPARPTVSLSLEAVKPESVSGVVSVIRDTDVPLQYIRWGNVVVHDSGRDGPDIARGCHFLIGSSANYGDGAVVPTRRWRWQHEGEHISVPGYSYNQNTIGICLLTDSRRAALTPEQFASLVELVRSLQVTFQIPRDHVYLHSDLGEAGCPGGAFPSKRFRRGLMRSTR